MSKKFSFDFKFLDRFRKKPKENLEESLNEEFHEELNIDDQQDNDNQFDADKTNPKFASLEDLNSSLEDASDPSVENLKSQSATNPNLNTSANVNLDDLVKLHREKIEAGEEIETSPDETISKGNFVELKNNNIDKLLSNAKAKQSFKFFSFKDKFQKFTSKKEVTEKDQKPGLNIQKLDWSSLVVRLFSPYNRHKIHAFFIVCFICLFSYLVGKNGALLLGLLKAPKTRSIPQMPVVTSETRNTINDDISKVTSVNLFNAKSNEQEQAKGPAIDIENIICTKGEKPTDLPLKLMDTVVLQDSVKSVASVQMRGNNELLNIREGEKLEGMAEVSKINRLSVVLKNLETGTCEYIGNLEDDSESMPAMKVLSAKKGKALLKSNNPEIKTNGNSFKITKNYRNKMLANINQILTEAKALEIRNPDGTLCYKMTEVVPGSIYSQLNIQDNDIICQINGKKIENLNEIMSLLGRIKEVDQFQLTLKRNGMSENLEYNFE